MQQLDPRVWNQLNAYRQLAEAKQAEIVRWLWTDGPRFDMRPLYFRRENLSRGRRLAAEPVEKAGHYQYGFDAAGELALARYHGASGTTSETLYTRSDSGREAVTYRLDEDGLITFAGVVQTGYDSEGRITAYNVFTPDKDDPEGELRAAYRELYTYQEGGKLAHIRSMTLTYYGHIETSDELLVYDRIGRLEYIHRQESDSEAYITYVRPRRGQTLNWLKQTVKWRLVEVVPQILGDVLFDPEDQLYCIALIYDPKDVDGLPPLVALGTTLRRDILLQHYRQDASDYLWDPEAFSPEGEATLELSDDALESASHLLNQQLAFLPGTGAVRALLNDAARELQRLNWGQLAPVSDDFVVYAVDIEFEHFEANFAYSVPPRLVKALAERGLY